MCTMNECPICFENIDITKNCVTTECGHSFHTSCLMKNIAFNGFECPYCRTEMAEELDDSDSNDSDYEEEGNDAENVDDDDNTIPDIEMNYPSSRDDPIPSFELILRNLSDKNITYEDLVKCIMHSHYAFNFSEDYDEYKKCADSVDNEIYETIVHYKPEQENMLKNSKYNFYFLEQEYKERENLMNMENSIEQMLFNILEV